MYDICIKIITLLSLYLPVNWSIEEETVFRVVNGKPAKLGEFPYQVALRSRLGWRTYSTLCGGALLRADKVLTAAHCVTEDNDNICLQACFSVKFTKMPLSSIYVVAATLVTTGYSRPSSSAEQTRRLSKIIIPDDYEFPKSDIAILLTKKPFTLNSYVGILPFATKKMEYGKRQCLVAGYGKISKNQKSYYLMWAPLELIPSERCSLIHEERMQHFICTSSDFTDVLQGDSGSPLVCSNTTDPADKGKGVIVGIVCGERENAGNFFTRVTSYKEFIESKAIVKQLPFTSMVFLTGLLRFL